MEIDGEDNNSVFPTGSGSLAWALMVRAGLNGLERSGPMLKRRGQAWSLSNASRQAVQAVQPVHAVRAVQTVQASVQAIQALGQAVQTVQPLVQAVVQAGQTLVHAVQASVQAVQAVQAPQAWLQPESSTPDSGSGRGPMQYAVKLGRDM